MLFKLFVLLPILPILGVSAELDHPVINPTFPGGGLDSLDGDLDKGGWPASHWDQWGAGWIPEDVKNLAQGAGFSANDIETYNVYYDDCESPWIMSRHKDADLSINQMVHNWALVPVRMRQYVRHLLATPGAKSAANGGDNIILHGPLGPSVFVHETAHSLDSNAMDPGLGRPFSSGQTWLDAYNADSAVPDGYARTSQQENFAQCTVVALFDDTVPFKLTEIQPSWPTIRNQYDMVKRQLGDKLQHNGRCTHRLENSKPVRTSGNGRRDNRAPPDVSLKGNVGILESTPMPDTIELTSHEDGSVVKTITLG